MATQQCKTCGQDKPEEEFRLRQKKSGPYRLKHCKECERKSSYDRYHGNIEKSRQQSREQTRRWQEKNRPQYLANAKLQWAKRKGRFSEEGHRWANEVLRFDPCAYCGMKPCTFNADHIDPSQMGDPSNLTSSCASKRAVAALPPSTSELRLMEWDRPSLLKYFQREWWPRTWREMRHDVRSVTDDQLQLWLTTLVRDGYLVREWSPLRNQDVWSIPNNPNLPSRKGLEISTTHHDTEG